MSSDKGYAELVAQAEQAVAGVKDAELRRVAFERVLDDLLSGKRGLPEGATKSAKGAPLPERRPVVGSKSGKAPRAITRSGPRAYIGELVSDDFFKKQKTISEVKTVLMRMPCRELGIALLGA